MTAFLEGIVVRLTVVAALSAIILAPEIGPVDAEVFTFWDVFWAALGLGCLYVAGYLDGRADG